jgi:hypothetical protein
MTRLAHNRQAAEAAIVTTLLVGVWFAAQSRPAKAIMPLTPSMGYHAELLRQCPSKQLSRLDPHDLRTVLQEYQATLPSSDQTRVTKALDNCAWSSNPPSASCEDEVLLGTFDQAGRLSAVVSIVCASYACNDQGDCTAAPK